MLKIHCLAVGSHRNAVSGVVETTASSTSVTVPVDFWISLKLLTTSGVPMERPLASQTRNLAGTVLFCLNTLLPSELMGWRMACPVESRQAARAAYGMLYVRVRVA